MPIQFRRDTLANWALANPVLAAGEPAFERDTNSLKIGDGTAAYKTLPYIGERDAQVMAPGGRLSASPTVPVIPNESTVYATNPIIYYVPYVSDKIVLWDGTKWQSYTFTNATQLNLNTLPVNSVFDIFAYQNNGVVTLIATQWTDLANRAVNLVLLNGIMVKSGNAAHRYLGTIKTNPAGFSTNTTVADTYTGRNIYNYYNQVPRLLTTESTTANTYASSAWRVYNGLAVSGLEFVAGVPSAISASYSGRITGGFLNLSMKTGAVASYVPTNPGVTSNTITFSALSNDVMVGDIVAQTGFAGTPVRITGINRTTNVVTLSAAILIPNPVILRGDFMLGSSALTQTMDVLITSNIGTVNMSNFNSLAFASSTMGVGHRTLSVLQFGSFATYQFGSGFPGTVSAIFSGYTINASLLM